MLCVYFCVPGIGWFYKFKFLSSSDSWERVSVGDCSGEDLSNKPQPGDPKPEPGETNPTLADSTPSVQPGKKKVNIERVFRYDFKQISLIVSFWKSY